jgi:hypothetical protein
MGEVGTSRGDVLAAQIGRNGWRKASQTPKDCAAERGADGAARHPYRTVTIRRCARLRQSKAVERSRFSSATDRGANSTSGALEGRAGHVLPCL